MPDSPASSNRDVTDPPGAVITDRYEVLSVIGQGSSARTLLCSDLREDRRVVLKELHFAHLSDWKHLELFEREAKMLARLDHSGIPKVYDYFQSDEGSASFYIVQEYIEGPSLLQRMDSGPMLGQHEIREIAIGLLDVLEYLHGRAPPVVHRDIKPSNVLLRADRTTVLIDFGGVRAGWQPRSAAGATVVGTFGYMAPEQVAGQGGTAGDLYSLGATLLHVVTGHPPSDFSFDTGRIEIPGDLPTDRAMAGLIEALLRPAPRDRPASAAAAREMLTNPAAVGVALSPRAGSPAFAGDGGVRPGDPAATPAHRQSRALAVAAPRRSLWGESGEPRFVDLGDPPRDPRGEFRDVYRNLMHPLFPARRPWSDTEHFFWVGFTVIGSMVTLGAAPALDRLMLRKRRKTYDHLFRHGLFAIGVIQSIPGVDIGAMYTMVRYEFEVDGNPIRGFMRQPREMTRYWGVSDRVAVLYDPDDPSISCIVYR